MDTITPDAIYTIAIGITIALGIGIGLAIAKNTGQASKSPAAKAPNQRRLPRDDPRLSQDDSVIKRNRPLRVLVLLVWVTLSLTALTFVGYLLANKLTLPWHTGLISGVILDIVVVGASLPRFIVVVPAFQAMVTIDSLKALLGIKNSYVSYGPGFHISFPWETRQREGNVSLLEASEAVINEVQLIDDQVTFIGSLRIRPDTTRLPRFIGGAAAAAEDIVDIVRSTILAKTKGTAREAINSVDKVNEALAERFGSANDSQIKGFEERFGVVVGDITIAKIAVSDELRKTMTGLAEAKVIGDGAAQILGYKNALAARRAVARGTIANDDIDAARKQFLAASENIKMDFDVNETTFEIKGLNNLDPNLTKALSNIGPAAVAGLAALGGSQNNQRRRSRKNPRKKGESNG